jgi:hypothetical protein
LSPALHDLAAVLANNVIRTWEWRFCFCHPIDGPARALVQAGKPFEESAHAAEYARRPAQLARTIPGCSRHSRQGQQSFSARLIASDVTKFFRPLDEPPLSFLLLQ